MAYPNPSYADGLNAVIALSVLCYNNGVTYMTYDGDPSAGGLLTDLTNSDKQEIGSVTYQGPRKGTLNLQYKLATDESPASANQFLPAYILSFRGRYYVAGKVGPKVTKNDVIRFSVEVTELQNPFIANLLTTLGQQLALRLDPRLLARNLGDAALDPTDGVHDQLLDGPHHL